MLIYVLIPFIIFFLGSFTRLNNKKRKLSFLVATFTCLFLIMALRKPTIGTDTSLYIDIFNDLRRYKFNSRFFGNKMMYLYSIYNIIVGFIFPFEQGIVITNSLIICVLSGIFIYRICNKHIVSSTTFFVLLYCYFASFNIARQYIAILLVANAIYYLINKNVVKHPILKYLLILCSAFFVHNTAIVGLIILPLFFISKKDYLTYFVICFFVILFAVPIMPLIITKIFPDYSGYFEGTNQNEFVSRGRTAILYLTNLFFVSLGTFLINKKKINNESKLIFLICLFSSCMSLVFNTNILVSRIISYFNIFMVAALPYVCDAFRSKSKIAMSYILFLIYFLPFVIQLKGHYGGIYSYEFFW